MKKCREVVATEDTKTRPSVLPMEAAVAAGVLAGNAVAAAVARRYRRRRTLGRSRLVLGKLPFFDSANNTQE